MRIEYTSNSDVIGCYDMRTDTIILNSKLKEYPELHDFVLEHEKLHYAAKENVLEQFWIDLTDNWKYWFSKRIKYGLWIGRNIKYPSRKYCVINYMNWFLWVLYEVATLFTLPVILYYMVRCKKEKKGC